MRYRSTHTALACLLLVVAGACSQSAEPPAPAPVAPSITVPAPAAPSVPSVPALKPRLYAALGDSYAAGGGLVPVEAGSGACRRSPSAYPRVLADQEGSTLDFAACSGATVDDLTVAGGQLASVDPASDLVTVTVGGNDAGFATVVGACAVDIEPCAGLDAGVEADLAQLGPNLNRLYRAIKDRAPRARLVVVGYPQVVPDPAKVDLDTCPAVGTPLPGRRITADDARWLREKGSRLNEVVSGAARATGATYVDVAGAFAGHEACTASPWLTGVVLTDLRGSFHPTVTGQAELARLVTRALA
jgi:lysophospholipase L1-like esterase